jgi:pyruvate-ferredoxin/flavodoxin oxidoreductase
MGIDLATSNHTQQELAVASGHFPLYRYDPRRIDDGKNPLQLDSKAPSIDFTDFTKTEGRFTMLARSNPEAAKRFAAMEHDNVRRRYAHYESLAAINYSKGKDK